MLLQFLCNQKTKGKSKQKPMLLYRLLKSVGLLLLIWPLDKNTKWFYRLLYEMGWWLFMMNEIFLFLGLSIGLYNFLDDTPTFTTVIFVLIELTIICENIYTSIIFKLRSSQIKVLISILENTVNNVTSKETILIKQYMHKSSVISYIRWTVYHIIFFLYIYFHFFKPTLILPKEVWHPFSIDPFSKHYLVFLQQLAYIFHAGGLNIVDGLVCMSMKLAKAKLEILSDKFKEVITNYDLRKCIRQHQDIIWYIKEIDKTMRFIILKAVLATSFYVIYAFLQVAHAQETLNLLLMLEFVAIVALANYRVYYCASCADDLMSMSENLRFSLQLIGKSRNMSRSMGIIILRCQKPLCISVCGIMPQFSLKYYGTFSYWTFSYFLTLKAILDLKIRFR